jgi:transposase
MTNTSNLRFKALPANSPGLFPEDIFERIPQNHPVRIVNQAVDGLDITSIIAQYKGGGPVVFIQG